MNAAAGLRRAAIFVVLFGGVMAIAIWQAGGLGVPRQARRAPANAKTASAAQGDVVPIEAGASMGRGRGVRITRDAVEVVDGEPISYRAFEAAWARQTPIPGGTIDERRLHTEEFTALLFHRRPTSEQPRPPAIEGPDTTRINAADADLEMGRGAAFRAQLGGGVEVVRHGAADDLTLRTDDLEIARIERARGAEELHATTDARVFVDGKGAHLEGTGLEADLGRQRAGDEGSGGSPPRVTLLSDVTGRLLARPGALTPQGGDSAAAPTPAEFSCAGAAELVELRPAARRRAAQWLLTLADDVVMQQGAVTMRCASLEVEFRTAGAEAGGGAPVEILRVVADGDVVVLGRDDATADTWALRARRSNTVRDVKGGYDVTLDGGTTLTFNGTLRGRGGAEKERGRVQIRCAGPATIHTDADPAQRDAPIRSHITFRDDVVARQWDATDTLVTEIRAPQVVLLGNRLQVGDGRIDADTLTATGTARERVHVMRGNITAAAQAITWRVLRDTDIERLLLSGRPVVRFDDAGGMNLAGDADATQEGTLLLDAAERVEITWRHTPAADLKLPPGEPYVTAIARKDVVMRRIVNERETYRMESQALDATLDGDLQPTAFRAYDRVVVSGHGERPGDRRVELRGDRISATRVPGEAAEWVRTDVVVFGQAGALATATVHESARDDGKPAAKHVVRAEQLRYEKGGTLLTAKRNAEIVIDGVATDGGGKPSQVHVRARELRAYLNAPASAPGHRAGAPELVRVEGEDGVSLETTGYRVTGKTLSYDRISGIAIARGRPARGILRHAVTDTVSLESFVASEEIRVEFAPPAAGSRAAAGRPRRVTCQGGMLRYYQISGTDDERNATRGQPDHLARFTLRAKGPIEILRETASAQDEVEIVWETQRRGKGLKQDARLICDRAELEFDTEAAGPARDRIRRSVATGSRSRPAQLYSPNLDATADRVESRGPWIDLLSPWGRRVYVRRRLPEESFTCEKGRYNYVTQEFEATRARAEER